MPAAVTQPAATPSACITLEEFRAMLAERHPFAAQLGMEILSIGHGTATARLPDNPQHKRLGDVIAGPMLMGLADMALYAAVVGATGEPQAVTATLNINFMRGATGGAVLAEARILKTGRITAGEVLLLPEAGGAPFAQAISTWSLPRKQ